MRTGKDGKLRMIGPAAAVRSFTRRPGHAVAVATGIALVTVWAGIALSYRTNWPLGFFTGVIGAGFFLLGQAWATVRRRWSASRTLPARAVVLVNRAAEYLPVPDRRVQRRNRQHALIGISLPDVRAR